MRASWGGKKAKSDPHIVRPLALNAILILAIEKATTKLRLYSNRGDIPKYRLALIKWDFSGNYVDGNKI